MATFTPKERDYKGFDAQLLSLIGSGVSSFRRLTVRMQPLALAFCTDPNKSEPFCVVDRRLQVLRKAGKITCLRLNCKLYSKEN